MKRYLCASCALLHRQVVEQTVYALLSEVYDPEKPDLTLADLEVITAGENIRFYLPTAFSSSSHLTASPSSSHLITCGQTAKCASEAILKISYCPTVPHCSMCATIALALSTKLSNNLQLWANESYPVGCARDATGGAVAGGCCKIELVLVEGSHNAEKAVIKQINDKERVASALENPAIMQLVLQAVRQP
eukprot:GHVS01070129.1.p1 GENE.GHVS01070129.1~~GHVS01070129.1.p1  ORF type:complete len:191 (-),score=23.12 GHVS01070129.1:180-752(-)